MGRQVPCDFCLMQDAFKTGKTQTLELTAPDGRIYVLTSTPFKDIDGKEKVIEIVRDITGLRKTDEKIKESERKFKEAIMSAPLPVMIHKEGGEVVSINEAWTEITGYKKEEIPTIGEWTKKAYGKRMKLIKEYIYSLYDMDRRIDEGEYEIKTKNGVTRTWHFSSAPLGESPDGKRLVISMALDVTEEKRREEEYKNLINGMNDTAFVIDFNGKFVEVNERAIEVLGYTREELLKMGPADIDPNLSADDIGELIEGMKKEGKQVFPTEHKTKDGCVIPVEISSSRIIYKGKPHILSIARDIIKRKEAEEALKKSEEQLLVVFNNTSDLQILFSCDEDGGNRIVSVNKTAVETARSLGFDISKGNFMGKKYKEIIRDFLKPEQASFEEICERFKLVRESGETVFYEESFKFGAKSYIAEISLVPILDKDDKTVYILWVSHDISKQKRVLKKLQESEERFQSVIENMPEGVCLHDLDGNMKMVNKELSNLTGYSEAELLGMNVSEVDRKSPSRDDRGKLWLQLSGKDSAYVESILHRKNGSTFPASMSLSSIDMEGERMILAVTQDITERKEAVKKIKESEERFQTVIENIPHGVSLHNLDGGMVLVNKALCDMTGYSRKELLSMSVSDIDPASRTRGDSEKLWAQMERGGSKKVESTHYRKDGSYYPAEVYLSAISLGGEKMIVGIAHDITKRVEVLEKLSKSEEKYRNLYGSMTDAFVNTDLEGKILEFNKHYLDMLGYAEEEIKKLTFRDITPGKWSKLDSEIRKEQILKRGYSDVYEKEYVKKDGTVFPVEVRSFLLNDEKGKPESIWSIVRDISERKKTEKELRKVERLESLGVLAGGIAHDFNNLLTGILGNVSLAQIKEGEDTRDLLEDAKQASIQAKNLTQQLLTFAKGGEPVKGEASMENIVKISSGFTLHGSNVKCLYDFPPDLWKVEVDKGQMSQVIDNLVINAKQAMPSGGKISIKAENMELKKDNSLPLPEGKYLRIIFSDDGMGIPKNHLSKIFDPYFTTKQRGSGLGLATVFSVIQKHDGYVTAESEPGKGTTFYIYLPAKEEEEKKEEKERKTKSRVERYLREEGKILVMDDEETVRNTLGGILKKLGYLVTLTTRGEDALTEYKKALSSEKPFDIVILDLTIAGGMGGKKTMKELLEIDPSARVIVSSGYSTDPIMAHFDEYGFKAVAVKPYDVDELVKAIRKAFE
jgi:PAS domain S-box-containing protein